MANGACELSLGGRAGGLGGVAHRRGFSRLPPCAFTLPHRVWRALSRRCAGALAAADHHDQQRHQAEDDRHQ